MSSSSTITVTTNPSKNPHPPQHSDSTTNQKPAHWVDDTGTSFTNPWPSWRWITAGEIFRTVVKMARTDNTTPDPAKVAQLLPLRTPTWGPQMSPSESSDYSQAAPGSATDGGKSDDDENNITYGQLRATWLGHACFLVEFPGRGGTNLGTKGGRGGRGVRILFDPVFSDRCSPVSFMGPKRYTQPPCKVEDIPEVDAIVISHNHYDHLDTHTLKTLLTRSPTRTPHIFAPLGNGPLLQSLGAPKSSVHIMDWWDSKNLRVAINSAEGPSSDSNATTNTTHANKALTSTTTTSESETGPASTTTVLSVDITCTPSQHFSGRMWKDNFKSLWASWCVEEAGGTDDDDAPVLAQVPPPVKEKVFLSLKSCSKLAAGPETRKMKVFFGGDTGYRSVPAGKDEDEVPFCPAFRDIGRVFGGFDLALLPIGAYSPRPYMSPVHCSPSDSVRIFQDIKARKGIGMHWGAWALTAEPFSEPPQLLKKACKKAGIPEGDFTVCAIGETVVVESRMDVNATPAPVNSHS